MMMNFKKIFDCTISANTSLKIAGLMFLIPFIALYHRQPIPSFYPEWLAAILGLMALITLLKRNLASSKDTTNSLDHAGPGGNSWYAVAIKYAAFHTVCALGIFLHGSDVFLDGAW